MPLTFRQIAVAVFTFMLTASPPAALAGGYEIGDQGARASGQAEAFTAQADDASAIYYNPAGLTQLRGSSITSGAYLLLPDLHSEGTGDQVLGPPPVPEGSFRFRGHDVAVGGTLGLRWELDERNCVGTLYRTPFTLDFDGSAGLTVPGRPEVGPAPSHAAIAFPQMAGVGYALRPVPRLKLEVDAVWTDWEVVDQVRLQSTNPNFNGLTLKSNWKSGFSLRFGTEYQLFPEWVIRGGYALGAERGAEFDVFAAGTGLGNADDQPLTRGKLVALARLR